MVGQIQFDEIPKLPKQWWDGTDAETVWPTWGKDKSYFWGANASNQFLDRGVFLNGGGLASPDIGPSRGYAHPQYVGLDTMSAGVSSLASNTKVYMTMSAYLDAGQTVVVPLDLREEQPDPGKFSLGTGIGIGARDGTEIHIGLWEGILGLIDHIGEANVDFNAKMWTPDMSQDQHERQGTKIALPDLEAIQAYLSKLKAAFAARVAEAS
ncbi:MAG: hypothetical protein AAGD04_08990 [Pseudomonadota bacterium]